MSNKKIYVDGAKSHLAPWTHINKYSDGAKSHLAPPFKQKKIMLIVLKLI